MTGFEKLEYELRFLFFSLSAAAVIAIVVLAMGIAFLFVGRK